MSIKAVSQKILLPLLMLTSGCSAFYENVLCGSKDEKFVDVLVVSSVDATRCYRHLSA